MKNKMGRFFLLVLLLVARGLADDRITKLSARFLGVPYMANPLGEGDMAGAPKASRGPRYRLDAFDCVSYVETVIALARTNSEEDFRAEMDKIRYKEGRVSFETRNHFTSVDWIPNNASRFSDATEKISLSALLGPARINTTKIDRQKWFERAHGTVVAAPVAESRLPYVPLDALLANRKTVIRAIEEPMVANIVVKYQRPSKALGTDNDIAHIGFLLPTKNGLIFRHASKRAGRVADSDFFKYLEFLKGRPENIGINFLDIKGEKERMDR
jgi:hypothetical protein